MIWGQNEIGTIQPISLVGKECNKRRIFFHTDATQILSQGLFDFNQLSICSFSASAHKLRGPKGIGILVLAREYLELIGPIQGGGGQEHGLRSGTQSPSLAHGMAIALQQIPVHISINNQEINFTPTRTTSLTKELSSNCYHPWVSQAFFDFASFPLETCSLPFLAVF